VATAGSVETGTTPQPTRSVPPRLAETAVPAVKAASTETAETAETAETVTSASSAETVARVATPIFTAMVAVAVMVVRVALAWRASIWWRRPQQDPDRTQLLFREAVIRQPAQVVTEPVERGWRTAEMEGRVETPPALAL
jgi:cytochrome bd-type quinol oxidase subunit 1